MTVSLIKMGMFRLVAIYHPKTFGACNSALKATRRVALDTKLVANAIRQFPRHERAPVIHDGFVGNIQQIHNSSASHCHGRVRFGETQGDALEELTIALVAIVGPGHMPFQQVLHFHQGVLIATLMWRWNRALSRR